ncbi:TPA: PTS glucose transporter subunit IIA, partial [Enterococcus faecium]|nr:PTS glucose transporter subunit IIA [Enterococcus faecium]HAZ1068403.1 PTS glucose transporter subunit IIA [Enterococcus faecium]HBM7120166.1 PTS glucose transporter subunit IIA [Enterococcus faecium]
PDGSKIYAPLAGRVTNIFPTKHAINIKSNSGIDYLIHIGIDTVELQGEPFSICVQENDDVTPETSLVDVDFDKIIKSGKDTSVIVVFPEKNQFNDLIIDNGRIAHGNSCGKITF